MPRFHRAGRRQETELLRRAVAVAVGYNYCRSAGDDLKGGQINPCARSSPRAIARRQATFGDAIPMADAAKDETDPLDRIVLRYLQKRGYKDAEKALKSEANIASVSQMALVPHLGADATISDHILYYNEAADRDPVALVHGYRLLRDWTHAALDMYKVRRSDRRAIAVPKEARISSAPVRPRGSKY
jgi:hypothetical protein